MPVHGVAVAVAVPLGPPPVPGGHRDTVHQRAQQERGEVEAAAVPGHDPVAAGREELPEGPQQALLVPSRLAPAPARPDLVCLGPGRRVAGDGRLDEGDRDHLVPGRLRKFLGRPIRRNLLLVGHRLDIEDEQRLVEAGRLRDAGPRLRPVRTVSLRRRGGVAVEQRRARGEAGRAARRLESGARGHVRDGVEGHVETFPGSRRGGLREAGLKGASRGPRQPSQARWAENGGERVQTQTTSAGSKARLPCLRHGLASTRVLPM